ncbi:MAG: DUF3098 domain-containing protein [Bacteroidota bacterium]
MSKKKNKKKTASAKKVAPKQPPAAKQPAAKPTVKTAAVNKTATTRKRVAPTAPARELTFGRDTYIWVGIGAALVFIGMLLMTGGQMPSPDVWDEKIIYSSRRITLAPIVILAGIGTVFYAILKK